MAITRCPYCHAITDENDKYCNNCGTQLLFTEDEQVEEEIPGEKIIDAEVEEKDYTIDEPEGEKRPAAAKDLETEIDDDLEEEVPEETEEMNLEELVDEELSEEDVKREATEEVVLVDEPAKSLDDTGMAGAIEAGTGRAEGDRRRRRGGGRGRRGRQGGQGGRGRGAGGRARRGDRRRSR